MSHCDGKTIIAGIAGGIAAYKAAAVVSGLRQRGAEVQVVMTQAATRFVTPLTFEALSHRPVLTDLFRDEPLVHVRLAHQADLLVLMPATFDLIGRLAHGLADDALTTLVAATRAPVLLVPAMESQMYQNPVYQENQRQLIERGFRVLEPDEGPLASGRTGVGRFPDSERILDEIEQLFATSAILAGRRILVTAGPTREPIDPMRCITNRSSGKMGYALARAARALGAGVTLISGPTGLPDPPGIEMVRVERAESMCEAVLDRLNDVDVLIMAAAVADWRPSHPQDRKAGKQNAERVELELVRTPDILTEVKRSLGSSSERPLIVGFAAESDELIEKAREKLERKGLDLIVANRLSVAGVGPESDENEVVLLYPDGRQEPLERASKQWVAHGILERISDLLAGR